MAAQAPEFIAIADGTQNFGNTQRAVAFYEVSAIEDTGTPSGIFNDDPLFSVWPGYEQTTANNYEEVSALAVNPSNGDTYLLSFDSGTPGAVDSVGDTEGDYDLYRFDINKIYADFIANNRPRGIMYHPAVSSDGFDAIATHGSAYPAIGGGLGIHTGRSNIATDGDTTNDFVFIDAIEKVGEVRRYGASGTTPFFDQQDLQFVDAETLLLMENKPVSTDGGALSNDYSFRTLERISTASGAASPKVGDTGGYNGNTTESWESFAWSGNNFVDMDNFAGTGSNSEVDGMRYVEQDGRTGAWVSERDGGGDDFQYFDLNFSTRVATKPGGFVGFALDENPAANDNQGDVDFFDVDDEGTLIIGESGFFDAPQTEPNIQTFEVTDYTGTVSFGTYSEEPVVAPTVDDDTAVTDGRFSVYERGQNRVYRFDIDSGGLPGVIADVYVYDLDTNTLVYQELNAVNHFTLENRIRAFTLGDFATTGGSQTSQDGIVDASDIDAYYALIADPTVGGRFSSAVGQEQADLDGDDLLTAGDPFAVGSVTGDMDYLVRRVLATEYGDTDLNAVLDFDDQTNLDLGVLGAGTGWSFGDIDGDGDVDFDDQTILDANLLANSNPTRV
jgi:hypothetical protein